jgi:hypothetical protein
MTHDHPESDELFELFSELVDGGLTPARTERLRALLRDDPEAQELYLRFMRVHAQLHLDYHHGSEPADMPGGSSMPLGPPSDLPHLGVGEHPLEAEFGEHDIAASPARFWPTASAIGWALALTFAIGLAVVLRSHGPAVPKARPALNPAPATVAATAPTRPLARVSPTDGVALVVRAGTRWEMADGQVPAEGDILPRGRLRIHEGRAILSMLSGVSVIVEGPAEIDLLSIDRIACNRGKLRARVPEGAEGFVVSGPGSAVVDLGTEFGVNIRPDGKSRGKVFEGEVEAAVLGQSGVLRRSRVVREQSEAFEIDPDAGLIGPLRGPEDFVSPFRPALAPLPLGPDYRDSVLSSRPTCYWRFESIAAGAIANEVAGQPALLVTGPIGIAGDDTGNRCAAFAAGQPDQRLVMDGSWKPERTPGYAVELWFLPEMIGHAALASLIAPKDTTHHLSLVELTSSHRLSLFPPATVRFLYRWPTGRGGGEHTFSTDVYVPYRWHHVVSQVAGDRMELYLNGALQTSQPIDRAGSTAACQLILGRLTTLAQSPDLHHTGYRRAFVGLMDEVALYDHPLSAGEIGARFRLARAAEASADARPAGSATGAGGRVPPREPGGP